MTLKEKVQFIIENEGCELADGYQGLLNFIQYCGENIDLEKFREQIEEDYEVIKEEQEDEEENREITFFGPGYSVIRLTLLPETYSEYKNGKAINLVENISGNIHNVPIIP